MVILENIIIHVDNDLINQACAVLNRAPVDFKRTFDGQDIKWIKRNEEGDYFVKSADKLSLYAVCERVKDDEEKIEWLEALIEVYRPAEHIWQLIEQRYGSRNPESIRDYFNDLENR